MKLIPRRQVYVKMVTSAIPETKKPTLLVHSSTSDVQLLRIPSFQLTVAFNFAAMNTAPSSSKPRAYEPVEKPQPSHPYQHKIRKRPAPQWDHQRERASLRSFSHSLGREPSPTPSTSSRYPSLRKSVAYRPSRLRNSHRVSEEPAGSTTNDDAGKAPDPGIDHPGNSKQKRTEEETEISSAAHLFNDHDPSHPFCQTAIRQLVEQIFSDDHFDAAISQRTTKLTEKLVGYGLETAKVDFVAADILDSARHSKATRLGRTLIDESTLHTFLEDVKAGVPAVQVSDTLRKWQRDLEALMSAVDRGVDAATPPPQMASPISMHSSSGRANEPPSVDHFSPHADEAASIGPNEDDDQSDVHVHDFEGVDLDADIPDASVSDDYVYDSYQQDVRGARLDDDMDDDFTMSGALPDPTVPSMSMSPDEEVLNEQQQMGMQPEHGENAASRTFSQTSGIDLPMAEPVPRHPQSRIDGFTERFPDALSVFVFHAHRLLGRKCTPERPGDPKVTERAHVAWSSLHALERAGWDALCLELQSGESRPLDPAIGAELLLRQGLFHQLKRPPGKDVAPVPAQQVLPVRSKAQPGHGSQSKHHPAMPAVRLPAAVTPDALKCTGKQSRSPKARSGPSRQWKQPRKRHQPGKVRVSFASDSKQLKPALPPINATVITYDADIQNAQRVAFILQSPDSPIKHVTHAKFRRACEASFGDDIDPDRSGLLHEGVWAAHFTDEAAATQAIQDGTLIQYNGISIFGEAFPRPTRKLECRLANTDVACKDLVAAVAVAFPFSHRCRLFRYPDDRFVMIFPDLRFIFRLYVPVERKAMATTHVCFRPMDPNASCSVCGKLHEDVCPLGERLSLRRHVHTP